MTVLWLVAWSVAALPPAFVGPRWNSWGIVLATCVVIDLISAVAWAYREVTRPEVERVWKPGIGWTYAGPELSKEE
jgi:hypothetical protein